MKRDMTVEQARAIVCEVTAERIRWGKNYGTGPYSVDQILDALVLLSKVDNERLMREPKQDDEQEKECAAEVAKLNRQLAAAKARETKLRKELKEAMAAAAGQDAAAMEATQ